MASCHSFVLVRATQLKAARGQALGRVQNSQLLRERNRQGQMPGAAENIESDFADPAVTLREQVGGSSNRKIDGGEVAEP